MEDKNNIKKQLFLITRLHHGGKSIKYEFEINWKNGIDNNLVRDYDGLRVMCHSTENREIFVLSGDGLNLDEYPNNEYSEENLFKYYNGNTDILKIIKTINNLINKDSTAVIGIHWISTILFLKIPELIATAKSTKGNKTWKDYINDKGLTNLAGILDDSDVNSEMQLCLPSHIPIIPYSVGGYSSIAEQIDCIVTSLINNGTNFDTAFDNLLNKIYTSGFEVINLMLAKLISIAKIILYDLGKTANSKVQEEFTKEKEKILYTLRYFLCDPKQSELDYGKLHGSALTFDLTMANSIRKRICNVGEDNKNIDTLMDILSNYLSKPHIESNDREFFAFLRDFNNTLITPILEMAAR